MNRIQQARYRALKLWVKELEATCPGMASEIAGTGRWFIQMAQVQLEIVALLLELKESES